MLMLNVVFSKKIYYRDADKFIVYPADYIPILPDSWGKIHQCASGVQIGFGADGAITYLSANKVRAICNVTTVLSVCVMNSERFAVTSRICNVKRKCYN